MLPVPRRMMMCVVVMSVMVMRMRRLLASYLACFAPVHGIPGRGRFVSVVHEARRCAAVAVCHDRGS